MIRLIQSLGLLTALGIAACGGGSDASLAPPASETPQPAAAVEYMGQPLYGTAIQTAVGSIDLGCNNTGCIETVSFDGVSSAHSADFFGSGEIVHVRATRPGYVSVDLQHAAIGPIESIDAVAGTLVVLGQRVYVTDQTLTRDPGVWLPDLTSLGAGDFVSVSGAFTGTGDIYATSLSRGTPGALLLRGILAASDGGGLRIGAVGIDLSAAELEGFPGSAPVPGDSVLLRARGFAADGRLVVQSLQLTSGVWAVDSSRKRLSGFVTASRSPTDFDVAGYRVDFQGCNCEPLSTPPAVGASVDIAVMPGLPSGIGLNILTWRSVVMTGPIESLDVAQGSITVLGTTAEVLPATYVVTNPVASYDLPSPLEYLVMPLLTPGAFAALNVGDVVTIVGGDLKGRLVAGAVFRTDGASGTGYIATSLRTIEAQTIRFFGQQIMSDDTTLASDCTSGPCQRLDLQTLFGTAQRQYFPPVLDITVDSAIRPLRAQSIRVLWQD